MGQYNGAVITTAGQAVLAQAIGGAELTITKVVTSAAAIPPGTDLTALTAIADVEQTAQPTSVQVFNDNIVQISTRFSNAGVAAAYLIQTLGVFGQVTGGAETLLAVSTAVTPDQMPAEDTIAPSAFIYNIQLTVQSADQITVTVNDAGTATVADVQALDAAKLGKSGDGQNVTVTFDETADPDVTSFATFLSSIVSGLSLSKLLRVIKTGLSYIAPKNHAADDVTYGGGDATNYGHVRLSNVYNSQVGTAAQSIGASQKAVYDAFTNINGNFDTSRDYFQPESDITVSQSAYIRIRKISKVAGICTLNLLGLDYSGTDGTSKLICTFPDFDIESALVTVYGQSRRYLYFVYIHGNVLEVTRYRMSGSSTTDDLRAAIPIYFG